MIRKSMVPVVSIALVLGMTACQTLPPEQAATERAERSDRDVADARHSEAVADDVAAPLRSLRWIVEQLELGRLDEAETALNTLVAAEPRNAPARNLLRQLTNDPVTLLGAEHTLYTVQPGDTLGELASRHLGDPLGFVALARYNDISRPRALRAGQTLKIPAARRMGGADTAAASTTAEAAAPAAVASGTDGSARMTQAAVGDDPAGIFRERIETALAAGRVDAALADVARAQASSPQGGQWDDWLEPLARRTRALDHQRRGEALLQQGRNADAFAAFKQAIELEPGLASAQRHLAGLRPALVAEHHEAAVVLFRNQQLDEAVALWDRALELDPGFEPARGYRMRALELKRRLEDL